MQKIDLNCDMGESFGSWKMGNDAAIIKYVSSVNIACGFHAGDPTIMREAVELAAENGVAIGAHPSYPDLQGFGRRSMSLSPAEVYDIVLYQVAALKVICEVSDLKLHHVKPHGALYNQAGKDRLLAEAVAKAVISIDKNLVLYGLSGSYLISEAKTLGLNTASEVFADRTYQNDGNLTPRSEDNAMIENADAAAIQVMQMINSQTVTSTSSVIVPIYAETVCIHGDGDNALEFAINLNRTLRENGIEIKTV